MKPFPAFFSFRPNRLTAAGLMLPLSWQWAPDTLLKASAGRAVRFPTVGELYGATSTANSQYINDPNLRPEKSLTTELTAEKDLGSGLLRLTFFTENTQGALYSQTAFDFVADLNISRVQNIDRIATEGLEAAYNGFDVGIKGLDLGGSVTYADSVTKKHRLRQHTRRHPWNTAAQYSTLARHRCGELHRKPE